MDASAPEDSTARRDERIAIWFLAVVLAPIVAVLLVAGYGFCVWMYQLIAGPPSM